MNFQDFDFRFTCRGSVVSLRTMRRRKQMLMNEWDKLKFSQSHTREVSLSIRNKERWSHNFLQPWNLFRYLDFYFSHRANRFSRAKWLNMLDTTHKEAWHATCRIVINQQEAWTTNHAWWLWKNSPNFHVLILFSQSHANDSSRRMQQKLIFHATFRFLLKCHK